MVKYLINDELDKGSGIGFILGVKTDPIFRKSYPEWLRLRLNWDDLIVLWRLKTSFLRGMRR